MQTAERTEPLRRPARWARALLGRPAVGRAAAALVLLAVSVLSLTLRRLVPHQLNTSGVDGLLYAEQAVSLRAGDWLGTYTLVTLAKLPGYPLFVAGAGQLGLPVKDAEQLVAIAAAALVGACVFVLVRRLVPAVAAFVVCALDPVLFSSLAADFLRDGLFASLSVVVVCSLFLTGHLLAARPTPRWGLVAAVLAGLPLGALLLLREEGLVVVPTALVALLAPLAPGLLQAMRRGDHRRAGATRRVVRPAAAVVAAGVLIGTTAAVPSLLVQQRNDVAYGVALTNDWVEGSFLEAYAQWQRVQAGTAVPRVPITTAQRGAVYAVSPTASLLAPRLEDPANAWRQNGCATPPDCDYAGGWMPWALRDAAATAGAYATAPRAQAFFAQIAQDVAAACADGRLSCRAALPGTLQSVQRLQPGPLLDAWGQHAREVLTSAGMYDQWPEVLPVPDDLRSVYVAASPAVAASADEAARRQARLEAHQWPFQVLAAGYTVLLPLATALGVVLLCTAVVGRTSRARRTWPMPGQLAVFAGVLMFAALVRVTMVAVVDVAEFEPDNARYTMPAHTLLVAFAAVVVADALRRAGSRSRRLSRGR